MDPGFEPPEGDALEPILALLSSPGERGNLVAAFARAVLRRVPAEELEDADPVSTGVALVDAFDFVDGREPGGIRVRLVDPRVSVDGWHSAGTVVQVSCDDRQFIVTTVKEELHRLGHKVTRMLHPVFGSERAADGRLTAILPARDAEHRESFLQVELGGRVIPEARRALVATLQAVLADVFAATGDFRPCGSGWPPPPPASGLYAALRYPADEVAEGADLLEWLLDDNFVLKGCCRIEGDEVVAALGIVPDAGLRSRVTPPSPTSRCGSCARPRSAPSTDRCRCTGSTWSTSARRPGGRDVPGDGRVQPEGGGRAVGHHPHAPVQAPPHPRAGGRGRGQLRREHARVALPGLPKEELFEADVETCARSSSGWPRPSSAATSRSCSRGAGRPHRVRPGLDPPRPL